MHKERRKKSGTSTDRLVSVFDAINDAIFVHDLETGAILDVNRKMCEMFGYCREEALAAEISDLSSGIPPFTREKALEWLKKASLGTPQLFEWQSRDRSGRLFWTEVNMRRAHVGDRDRILVSVRDISERKQAREELERAADQWQTTFDTVHDMVMLVDSSFRIVKANRAVAEYTGTAPAYLIGKSCFTFLHGTDEPPEDCPLSRLVRTKRHEEGEIYNEKTGSWLSVSVDPVLDSDGNLLQIVHVLRDITERKKREQEMERVSRLYAALSQLNQAIVKIHSTDDLFQEVCRVLVEYGKFRLAWIGLVDPVTKRVEVFAQRGDETGYLREVTVFADDRPEGRGPTGTAIREERTYVCNDFLVDLSTLPWRKAAETAGWRSSAAFPIRRKGKVCGALTVYDCEAGFFGDKEVALLEEAALDVSFGIENFHREALRMKAEADLRRSEEKFRNIYESAPIGIFQSTERGRFLRVNSTMASMFGYESPQEMVAAVTDIPKQLFVHPEQRREILTGAAEDKTYVRHQVPYFRKDRSIFIGSLYTRAVRDATGRIAYLEGFVEDVTEARQHEEQLLYQANYDILTGLPNRNLLNDRLNQAIANADRYRSLLGLMLMDLDNFKFINDTMGHNAGDLVLVEVARRLTSVVRKSDTVARLGGDEFVVVPCNVFDGDDVARVAEQILQTLSEPFLVDGREICITVSIGVAVYPQDGDSLERLLQHADVAMYHAKHLGKNTFEFFTGELNDRIHRRLELETSLRRAIEKNEFRLHYQPLVELNSKRVTGMEVLLRWQPEGEEPLSPDAFIPLLEETGLIIPVGEWVLRKACQQLGEWNEAGFELKLAVNVSARQFRSLNIVDRISRIVQLSGCSPGQICLELTESVIMEDLEVNVRKLTALREMGFSLSVDDFGTGFSSLSYLQRLPISEIKIDRTFVNGLPANANDTSIVNTIIQMANCLGIDVIAEGIEREEQVDFLCSNGCNRGQGYLFGKPLPPHELKFRPPSNRKPYPKSLP